MKKMTVIEIAYSLALVVSVRDTDTGDSFDAVKELVYLTFIVALIGSVCYWAQRISYQACQAISQMVREVMVVLTVWTKIAVWSVT